MSADQFKTASPASRWVKSLVVHGGCLAALFAWKALGYEWAGNLAIFWLWIVAISWSLFALVPEENKPARRDKRLPLLWEFNLTALVVTMGILVAFDHYVLGGFLAFGLLGSIRDLSIYNDQGYKRDPQ